MKHSAGRKERRRRIRQNVRAAGRAKMKWNNFGTKHPGDKRFIKEVHNEENEENSKK